MSEESRGLDPARIGSEGPPVAEKPFKLLFEANACIGAGRCAAVAANWEMNFDTGLAKPRSYFIDEAELEENIAAAFQCPAKKGSGVIHVIDRRTGEEIAPDPDGDGSISVDW